MTTERIDIVVREDGSRVVKRNISDIGNAADGAADSLDTMKNILAGLVTGAVITGLARMADTYTTIQNKLRLVTTGTENLARVTKELQGIANATRTDFESTAELYSRVAGAAKDLGLSQKQLLGFTKSLNQAVVLSGASAEEAAGGLRQLAQGLASGTLRGDELNSVMENFPKVADIIAEGMGKTRGELRALGAEGKITAQNIIDAFAKAETSLNEDFATTVPTISQAFTVLKNNLLIAVGEFDQATGISKTFAQALISISNNLNIILPVLAGVATSVAIAFSVEPLTKFAGALKSLYATAMANPWVALATILAGVLTTLYLLRDEIKLGIDDTTTLGDLMRAAWEDVGPAITAALDLAAQFFSWLTNTSAGTFEQLINDIVGYEHQNESMWFKILRIVVQVFDMIGGTIRGTMAGVDAVIRSFIGAWLNNFAQLGNAIDGIKELDAGKIKDAITSNLDGYKQAATNVGETFSKAFQAEILSQSDSGLESILDDWAKRAQEIGKERLAAQNQLGDLAGAGKRNVLTPVDADAAKKAARELERLKNALNNVLDAADPVAAAKRRLAEAQEILTKAVKADLIEEQKAVQVYDQLKDQLRDQLDPLGAINRMLDENIGLLKMGNEQRQVEADLLQFTEQLRRDGIKLTSEETSALRAKLVVEQELTRIAQLRDQLEKDSQASRTRDLRDTVSTATGMVGQNGYKAGDAVNAVSSAGVPGLENTTAQLQLQQEQYAAYYAAVDEMRQQDLLSETEAMTAKVAIFKQQYATQFQAASDALTNLSSLQRSENKKQAAIGKAAAIAQTVINTYSSAQSAYSAMAGIPYVGPFLGIAAAAAAVAAGMANVQAIRSQNVGFRTGGSMVIGGSGGPDSQNVSFRGTPGERVTVHTPAQARALERLGEDAERPRGARNVSVNQTIMVQGRMDKRTPDQLARAARRETRKEFERSGS